ncbi:heat shock protein 70 family [Gautieria morchelliformis]|nr:heat shock protein 70 family [Gautieria morchelliformis]
MHHSQASMKLEIESFESGNDFSETLTRAKFEELKMDLFRKTMKPIALVGGSTTIPNVQQLLKQFFGGKDPSRSNEAVAYGVPIQGGVLSGEEGTGDITTGGVFMKLIPPNTVVPTKQSQIFGMFHRIL